MRRRNIVRESPGVSASITICRTIAFPPAPAGKIRHPAEEANADRLTFAERVPFTHRSHRLLSLRSIGELSPGGSIVAPVIREAQAAGATTLRAIAAALDARGLRTPQGKK